MKYLAFGPVSVSYTDRNTWTKNKKLQESYHKREKKKTSKNKQTINSNRRLAFKYSLFNCIVMSISYH